MPSLFATCVVAQEVDLDSAAIASLEAEIESILSDVDAEVQSSRETLLIEGLGSMDQAIRAAREIQRSGNVSPAASVAREKALSRKDFTDLNDLVKRYEESRAAHKRPTSEDSALMLFVSFSMPPDVIREYTRQANATGATLILRGNYEGGTVRKTTEYAATLNTGGAGWLINPELFTGYKVDSVPVLVLSLENLDADTEGCFPVGEYASVFGEISIIGSLEKIAEQASKAEIRDLAIKRLAKIERN